MAEDYDVQITDVEMSEFEHIQNGPVRLKADGRQMMHELVALEVLIDVLRCFGDIREMVENAQGRMMPEWGEKEWRKVFERHITEGAQRMATNARITSDALDLACAALERAGLDADREKFERTAALAI